MDIFELDGQTFPSDSIAEEEEEEYKADASDKEENLQPEATTINNLEDKTVEKIDFSEFDQLSKDKSFPSNVIDLIDQYLEQYLNYVNNDIILSSDSFETFNKNLLLCCKKIENSLIFEKSNEKIILKFQFKLRHATFYLISFIASKNPSDSSNFIQIIDQFDDIVEKKDPGFFQILERYYILFSAYLVIIKFNSFESITDNISWLSLKEDHLFENEIFAPYICIADGIKYFSHSLYKQAALRSYTAFNLLPKRYIEMKKKCLVLYYFSSFFLINEINIIPASNQKYFENLILYDRSLDLISNSNEIKKICTENKENTVDDNYKFYFKDENLLMILQFVKYHIKRDYQSAISKSKELCQKIGAVYDFVLRIPINNLPNIIKKRSIIHFIGSYSRIQVDFIRRQFSFNTIEEARALLIEMIRKKEINHFLNDSNDILEIDRNRIKKDHDPLKELETVNGLLNSFIESLL